MQIYTVDIEQEPEFGSYAEFVQLLEDEERNIFTHVELQKLSLGTNTFYREILRRLIKDGFHLKERTSPRHIRTFSTPSHDRWFGPGSSPTHGGSGWEQISGFAGRVE